VATAEPHIISLFYESPMEDNWEIAGHVRGHFLLARDEAGRSSFPQEHYLFPYAQTPEELESVLRNIAESGLAPQVMVVNLHNMPDACGPVMGPWLGSARLLAFSRARDGPVQHAFHGSEELRLLGHEMADRGASFMQYGTADKDQKIRGAVRWVEGALDELLRRSGE